MVKAKLIVKTPDTTKYRYDLPLERLLVNNNAAPRAKTPGPTSPSRIIAKSYRIRAFVGDNCSVAVSSKLLKANAATVMSRPRPKTAVPSLGGGSSTSCFGRKRDENSNSNRSKRAIRARAKE
jgi:hypothetical protein